MATWMRVLGLAYLGCFLFACGGRSQLDGYDVAPTPSPLDPPSEPATVSQPDADASPSPTEVIDGGDAPDTAIDGDLQWIPKLITHI